MLLEIVNADFSKSSVRHTGVVIEMLFSAMMTDYIEKQGKKFYANYSKYNSPVTYDGYAPEGFDEFTGRTVIELKVYRDVMPSRRMALNSIQRSSRNNSNIKNFIFVIANEIPSSFAEYIKEKIGELNFRLTVWGVDKLAEIFSQNTALFNKTYSGISTTFLKDTITRGIESNAASNSEKRQSYVKQLINEYRNDRVVLFLGAGVSYDAKIPDWNTLISKLFVTLIDKQLSKNGIILDHNDKEMIIKATIQHSSGSPLLQARFLRSGLEEDFETLVTDILYSDATETSVLLDAIGQLCVPRRGKNGIHAVINYNFDDLIEKNLEKLNVKYRSIYGEGMTATNDELGIYHVHGFLPQNKDGYTNLAKSLLVFSEEGYHKLSLEPYSWANLAQLNYLANNTCLFIGLSMTDPNLRRLLEVAALKLHDGDNSYKHYAIMKRFKITDTKDTVGVQKFESINDSLQESFYKELGINVIWVDDYSELPKLLVSVKG